MLSYGLIELSDVLEELFPGLSFFPPPAGGSPGIAFEEYEICRLARTKEINEKEKLVREMRKSKYFAAVFPKDAIDNWDELEGKIRDGDCNVMTFFINKINDLFIQGFNSAVLEEIRLNDSPVTDLFNREFFEKRPYHFTEFDEPKKLNICEHLPPTFYNAFEYYAHKQYTLIRMGREFPLDDLHKKWKSELEKKLSNKDKSNNYLGLIFYYDKDNDSFFIDAFGRAYREIKKNETDIKYAWKIINELFVNNLKRLRMLREEKKSGELQADYVFGIIKKINNALESTPAVNKNKPYIPTDFITLTGQISGQLGHRDYGNSGDADFLSGDMENIRNYWEILWDNLDAEEKGQIDEHIDTYEKVNILYAKIHDPYLGAVFPESAKEIITGLYVKISWEEPLNEELDADEKNSTGIEYYDESEIREVREKMAEFIMYEFRKDDEKDFVEFIRKDGDWSIIAKEIILYYRESELDYDTLIFKMYKGKRRNATHRPFANKMIKVIDAYKQYVGGKNGRQA